MTDPIGPEAAQSPAKRRIPSRIVSFAAGAALLALGAAAGAGGWALAQPEQRIAFDPALAATAISSLPQDDMTKIEGRVTDIFGNKFVLEDATGRALVDTGRDGEDGSLVTKDETVKVQGRFERDMLHATAIQHADGKTTELRAGPPHTPHGGSGDKPHRHGPDAPPPPAPGGRAPAPEGDAPPPPPAP